jgi:receptor protein-tyrosine kinase
MSRNFDLMQQLEADRVSTPDPNEVTPVSRTLDLIEELEAERESNIGPVLDPILPAVVEKRGGNERLSWASDEALRLVQQIFLQTQTPPRVVVFAGIDHGNGSSIICGAVGEALAKNSPGQVCMVEGNFRSPGLPGLFGTPNHRGLTDALLREGPIRSFAGPVGQRKLWLLSSGMLAADSPNLLGSDGLKARLAELRTEFEFVLVDAPPLTRYADAIALAQLSDGLVLVLEADSTRKKAALTVTSTLRASNVPILGAVLNKRTFPIPENIYSRL